MKDLIEHAKHPALRFLIGGMLTVHAVAIIIVGFKFEPDPFKYAVPIAAAETVTGIGLIIWGVLSKRRKNR